MDLRFWNRPRICSRRMILEALEERIVMDAAVDQIPQDNLFGGRHADLQASSALDPWHTDGGRHHATAEKIMPVHSAIADTSSGALAHGVPAVATQAGTAPTVQHDALSRMFTGQGLDIVLVSTDADKFDAISHAVNKGAHALVFDPASENLSSIAAKLQHLTSAVGKKIEHLAIVAPGADGHLKIGADDFTAKDVDAHQGEFKALAQSLTTDARIDLYGCDVAKGTDGANLVNKVASATGVKVWASNDVTGTVPGANWDLEVKSAADDRPYMIDSHALGSYQIHLASPEPGPDPDHHVNKTANGRYNNLELTATDTDQPDPTLVTFTVPVNPAEGTVTLTGSTTETSPGAYQHLFRFQSTNPNAMVTGPVVVNYNVSSQGFPDTGTDIAPSGPNTVNCAAFGNVNADGIPDIVLGTTAGAYSMTNNADGTFTAPTLVAGTGGFNVRSIALGPIQPVNVLTGLDDLILGINGRNRWVENNVGVWGTVRAIGTAGVDIYNTTALVVADLNNANGRDLIEVNSSGTGGVVYPHQAAGPNYLSGAGVPISAGVQPVMTAVAAADVDGLAGNDVILGVDAGQVRWHHGNNNGTVDPTINTVGVGTDTYRTMSLLVSDVNGDANPDIIQGNASGQQAEVYMNAGAGSFATAGVPVADTGWAKGVQFTDMNGDGNPDLVFGNQFGPVMYFLGDGTGNFGPQGIQLNSDGGSAVAISVDPNWNPANVGPEVVVINDTVTSGIFSQSFPHRMYSWGAQNENGVYTLEIDAFNRPPVDQIDGSADFLTHPQVVDPLTGRLVFSAANLNALTVPDPDAFTDPIQVTLTADNGNDMYLGATVPGTLTVAGNGTAQIVLTGPQADIATAMDGLLYRSHRDRYVDSEGLTIATNDQGHNESGTASPGTVGTPKSDTERVSITVNVTRPNSGGDAWWNERPHNRYNGTDIRATNPAVPPQTDATGRLTFTGTTQITVWDPDADLASNPVVVTLLPVGGDIRLTSTTPAGVTLNPVGDNTDGGLILTGSINSINAALDGMTFRSLPVTTGVGPASLTIVTNDQGYNDHDPNNTPVQNAAFAKTDTDTLRIDNTTIPVTSAWWNQTPVNQVNGLPIPPVPAPIPLGGNGTVTLTGINALSVADDAETHAPLPRVPHDADLTVTLSGAGGDLTLANTAGLTFTQGDGVQDESMIFTGDLASINTALSGAIFRAQPVPVGAPPVPPSISITTNDLGHNPPDYVGPRLDTDTIPLQLPLGFNPVNGWWNQAPVNNYGAAPVGPGNPASALMLDAVHATLTFDGTAGLGHANFLTVTDDADAKAPLPRVPHDADVQTTLSAGNGIFRVPAGWPATVAVTNNLSNQVTLVGPTADLNTALRNLIYFSPSPDFVGGDTLLIRTNDLGHNPPDYVGPLTDTDAIPIIVTEPKDASGNVFWGRWPRR